MVFFIILCRKSLIFISFLPFFFFNKVILQKKKIRFLFYFFVFLSSSYAACDLCHLNMTVWFSSSYYDAIWWVGDSNGKAYSINTSSQIMVVNMLQNFSHMYYSYHRIIKCVGFKPIHCAINLNTTSSSRFFNEFDSLFLSDVLLF